METARTLLKSKSLRASLAESEGAPIWLRYLCAIAIVALALWTSLLLQAPFDNPFWFLFCDRRHLGDLGIRQGTGLGSGGAKHNCRSLLLCSPYRSWQVNWKDVPFFLTFCLCQAATNWLFVWRRDTEEALPRAHDQLEIRVEERTAELKAANEALLHRMAEQRRAEEALQVARAELTRVARITMVGELATSIAHEVNQPLAAIVANADACVAWLGLDEPDLAEARAAAERAVEGATRAADVIKRIRSLIYKTALERALVQLNQVIQDTVALAAGQASRNQVQVTTELMPDLPVVVADRIQLQQVLLNLINNGVEATAQTAGRVRQLTIKSASEDGGHVKISVEDNGAGINNDAMKRLFEPFFTTKTQGIGLGLAISRSIVEAHGGRLSAEPHTGQGSVFKFTLPRAYGVSA